jgi:hypothetical protein
VRGSGFEGSLGTDLRELDWAIVSLLVFGDTIIDGSLPVWMTLNAMTE